MCVCTWKEGAIENPAERVLKQLSVNSNEGEEGCEREALCTRFGELGVTLAEH